MDRAKVIAVASIVAVAGAVIPIAAMLRYSDRVALDREHDELRGVAERATTRAQVSMDEVDAVLTAAAGLDVASTCSPEHIAALQVLAFDARVVEEIGFFEDGFLRCTSWGQVDGLIVHENAHDYVTTDGIEVTSRMDPQVTEGKQMIALERGDYNVLVDPARFSDVIVDEATAVALVGQDGSTLSMLHQPDPEIVDSTRSGESEGLTGDVLYATHRAGEWTAVATAPRSALDATIAEQRRLLIPVALVVAAVPVGLVIWFSRRRLSLRGELATAIRRREFTVHYQPLIELGTGRCIGAEALVRWQRPDGILVRPDLFIPLAEESGIIEDITEQVIEAIGRDLGELLRARRELHIAVNLCAADVRSGRAMQVLDRVGAEHGILASQLWLEITERGFVDVEAAGPLLEGARTAGHAIAIDDFGTGYSTLSHLQQLPLDVLKIDKSFVDVIGTDAATSAVTRHIIDMARELQLRIVAEGVQTVQQRDYLTSHGVEYAQGWLFAPGMAAEDFIEFCEHTHAFVPY